MLERGNRGCWAEAQRWTGMILARALAWALAWTIPFGCSAERRPAEVVLDLSTSPELTRGATGVVELSARDLVRWRRDHFGREDPALWLPLGQDDTSIATRGACQLRSRTRRIRGVLDQVDSTLHSLEAGPTNHAPITLVGDCRQVVIGDEDPPAPRTASREGEPASLRIPSGWFAQADFRGRGDETLVVDAPQPVRVSLRGPDGALRHRSLVAGEQQIALRTDGLTRIRLAPVRGDGPVTLRARIEREPRVTPPPASVRGVVVLLLDTLRADRVGAIAPGFPTTNLDAFAASGATFTRAYSTASWTKPSVASALSARFPWEHRAITHRASVRADIELLLERLQAAGVTTAAMIANGYISDRFGFARGWDHFVHTGLRAHAHAPGGGHQLVSQAEEWISRRGADERFFLYLHTTDVHAPYHPRPEFITRFDAAPYEGSIDFERTPDLLRMIERHELEPSARDQARLRALYDAGVTEHDDELGELLAMLRARDDIAVLVMADHGEELFDHGSVAHGGPRLHEELIHIPMIARWPGVVPAGARVESAVSLLDVSPTVLDALGEPTTLGSPRARSLRHALTAPAGRVVAFGETDNQRGVSDGRFRYVRRRDGSESLHDLASDPGASDDLSGSHAVLRSYMQAQLARLMADAPTYVPPVVHEDAPIAAELGDQLRALGYLDE